ncbi:MAG: hypothetical protein AVDCRST_MAG20-103, partial [uncultured Acidimicrobiales bacterium]
GDPEVDQPVAAPDAADRRLPPLLPSLLQPARRALRRRAPRHPDRGRPGRSGVRHRQREALGLLARAGGVVRARRPAGAVVGSRRAAPGEPDHAAVRGRAHRAPAPPPEPRLPAHLVQL